MALGVPSRAFIRRKKAPRALCAWCKLRAARRRATVTRCAPGRTRRDSTLPPEHFMLGTEAQPAPEVFHARPPGHVRADCTEEDEGGVFFDPFDGRHVDTRHAI